MLSTIRLGTWCNAAELRTASKACLRQAGGTSRPSVLEGLLPRTPSPGLPSRYIRSLRPPRSDTARPFSTTQMATMKALVYGGVGQPILKEVPKPKILQGTDAVVKMLKTTICGTDLHILKGDVPTVEEGRILGHEGIAVVESVGDEVKNFKPGDRVIVACITACASCTSCKKGLPAHCADGGWILGNTIDGTQAEFVRIPHADASLHKMVQGASEEEQVMLSDVLVTGYEIGVLNGRVETGRSVAIVGSGPVGVGSLITLQLFSPSKIVMIDLDPNRLEKAKTMGATHTVVSGPNAAQEVLALTNGEGIDVVIEAVGIPASFELCQEIVAVGGTIANMGVHGTKVDLHLEKLWDKNISITTGLVNATSAPELLEHLNTRKLVADKLVTAVFGFSNMLAAYSTFGQAAKHNALKILVNFD